MAVWNEQRRLFGCFAVPAAILELFVRELIGQRVVPFFEVRADAEDSAVDAGLGFAVKVGSVVEPLVDPIDHFASLLAGRVETEVLQDDQRVKRNK